MARRLSQRRLRPSPFEVASARQQHEMFDAALSQVPPLFREVLVLRFQEQMKLEEIAKLIRIPVATVKTQNLPRRDGVTSRAEGRHAMTNHEHERAIDIITRRGVEDIAAPDAAWLESHLVLCSECAEYARLVERPDSFCGRWRLLPARRWWLRHRQGYTHAQRNCVSIRPRLC